MGRPSALSQVLAARAGRKQPDSGPWVGFAVGIGAQLCSTAGVSAPKLVREGLKLGDEIVPLYAGAMHYWHHDPSEWRSCLVALKEMGLRMVDIYVPWSVHERPNRSGAWAGKLDFGQDDPRHDVGAFLRLAMEVGLYAIVRPGPHVNAELTYFGIPERVIWDPACQARSPEGNPVMLPVLPKMFPVPSYASEAFVDEATRYFEQLGKELAPLCYPNGPIVLLQIDNEGALYFRDGAYDQDYHPDSIRQYRDFLRKKYKTLTELHSAYLQPNEDEQQELKFATMEPPRRFQAQQAKELVPHLDWAQFQEHMVANALERFSTALKQAGFAKLPTIHNFPLGQQTTPLSAARIGEVVDLIGLDYYGRADESNRASIARRTSELSLRCDHRNQPAFASAMGAGFAPYYPPLSETDSAFVALASFAYGLRGMNVYMAVERDRWIGAPIDRHGKARDFASFWRQLIDVLDGCNFGRLKRRVPVRIVVPRIERRIARIMHAFGPASGALLHLMGYGPREGASEFDLGLGYPIAIQADSFVRAIEDSLNARGLPYAIVGGEDCPAALDQAQWVICASSGAMPQRLWEQLSTAAERGAKLTLGPRQPRFDEGFELLGHDLLGEHHNLLQGCDPSRVDAAVGQAVDQLQLTAYGSDPEPIQITIFEDEQRVARVLFVLNPSDTSLSARIGLGIDAQFEDAFEQHQYQTSEGVLDVLMKPRSVRMLLRR